MGKYFRPLVLTMFYLFTIIIAGIFVVLILSIFRKDEIFSAESDTFNIDIVGKLLESFYPFLLVISGILSLGLARVMKMTDFKGAYSCHNINWRTAWIPIIGTILLILIFGYSIEHIFVIPDGTPFTDKQSGYSMMDIVSMMLLILVSPVIEELLFFEANLRCMLTSGCTKTQAVIASAIIFAVLRVHPTSILTDFVVGIIFAMLFIKTGNIVLSTIMHILNNTSCVILMNFYHLGGDSQRFPIAIDIVVILLCLYPAYRILRYYLYGQQQPATTDMESGSSKRTK